MINICYSYCNKLQKPKEKTFQEDYFQMFVFYPVLPSNVVKKKYHNLSF